MIDVAALDLPTLEPRGAVMAELLIGDRPIRIVGMHLDLSGLWRRRQMRAILDAIHRRPQKMPTILMGDTNEWRDAAGCLKELNGAYRVAPTGPSFHSRRPIAALDRIIVDHRLAIEAAGVHASSEARKASDHLPIWARVAEPVAAWLFANILWTRPRSDRQEPENMIAALLAVSSTTGIAAEACPIGLFQSPNGLEQVVDHQHLSPAIFGSCIADGRRGGVAAPDSPFKCSGGLLFKRAEPAQQWVAVALRTSEAEFVSHGSKLHGTLIEPPGGPHPLVVLVHGSERTSPMKRPQPYVLASYGLSVFAYDKRGTEKSEGEYTQNFELLADDAAAALTAARQVAAGRFTRSGYFGGSQAGWIAPLAATRSSPDFVAIGYGLVASPMEEDREQVLSEMRSLGYAGADLAGAGEVADAAGAVVALHFTGGFDQLANAKRRYGSKPWFGRIKGEFTGAMLMESEADLKRVGGALFDNLDLIWDYDSLSVMRRVKTPQLWVLAEADREAPHEISLGRLQQIRNTGGNVAIFSFPDTDHGMLEYTQAPDGTRTYHRVTEGYLPPGSRLDQGKHQRHVRSRSEALAGHHLSLPPALDRRSDAHRLAIFGDGAAGEVEALVLEQVDQRVVA